jgi:protein-L-isoaspartate(D-aspartate) O-methyltransferase
MKNISDDLLLQAISNVEREKFVSPVMKPNAYKDIALPIGYGQTISQPYTIAVMTQALQIKKGDKVLEIGTGSGYQAAILFQMGAKVYSIERNVDIYHEVLKRFEKLGVRVHCKCGDGTLGWDSYSPFDKIIVTAGAPDIPVALKKQLAINGKMVIPVGTMNSQTLRVLTKTADNEFEIQDIPQFAFVPLIGREGWKE